MRARREVMEAKQVNDVDRLAAARAAVNAAKVALGERAQLKFGVFNLTDKKYWEWSDVRGIAPTSIALDRYTRPGINAGVTLTLQF